MSVSKMSRLPVRELDFGFGAPEDVLIGSDVYGGAGIISAKDGVEILLVPRYLLRPEYFVTNLFVFLLAVLADKD
jgi:hypothetical protein